MVADFESLNEFWERLAGASHRLLLLDYDGTLAPFRVERNLAIPYPGVRERLTAIITARTTRPVIVSGRSIDDLLPLLGLEQPPELWGCHGWERQLADGRRIPPNLPEPAQSALAEARDWAGRTGLGGSFEIKPASVAVHWRGLTPGQQAELEKRARQAWEVLAGAGGLEIHQFDGGLELRCPGRDKGTAVQQLLDEVGTDSVAAYLGDDFTDEDAFRALRAQDLGVLVRAEQRSSAASFWVRPPAELLAFLERWESVCSRG